MVSRGKMIRIWYFEHRMLYCDRRMQRRVVHGTILLPYTLHTANMQTAKKHFKGLKNNIAPRIDNPAEIQQSVNSITWDSHNRRVPSVSQPLPTSLERIETVQPRRVNTPPPPVPGRDSVQRIRQIRVEHLRSRERQRGIRCRYAHVC